MTKWRDSTGREIDDVEIDHGRDPVDSFIQSATYLDDGSAVPEVELDWMTYHYSDVLAEEGGYYWAEKASAMAEGDR